MGTQKLTYAAQTAHENGLDTSAWIVWAIPLASGLALGAVILLLWARERRK